MTGKHKTKKPINYRNKLHNDSLQLLDREMQRDAGLQELKERLRSGDDEDDVRPERVRIGMLTYGIAWTVNRYRKDKRTGWVDGVPELGTEARRILKEVVPWARA